MAQQNESRYWQSYSTARLVVNLGKWLRLLSLLLLALGLVVGLSSGSPTSLPTGGSFYAAALSFGSAAASLFVLSIVLEVLGRMLVMATDIAINSSPNLTDGEKATIVDGNWKD